MIGSTGPYLQGVVRHFDPLRRFGKIQADRVEYFVHASDLVDVAALRPGQQVLFQPVDAARGPRAVAVTLVDA